MSPIEQTGTPKAGSSNIGTLKASIPADPTNRATSHEAGGMGNATSFVGFVTSTTEPENNEMLFATNLRDDPLWLTADPSMLSAEAYITHSRLDVIARALEAQGKLLQFLCASILQNGQMPTASAIALKEGEEKVVVGQAARTSSKGRCPADRVAIVRCCTCC